MATSSVLWHFSSSRQTNTKATHIVPRFHQWETYQHRFRFLLHIKQLASAARCWVQFDTWVRFSLYELHAVLLNTIFILIIRRKYRFPTVTICISSTPLHHTKLFVLLNHNMTTNSTSSWFKTSETWCYVLGRVVPDARKDHDTFIFRVMQSTDILCKELYA